MIGFWKKEKQVEKVKITIEVETNTESKVSAYVLSNYILRAIAGVAGNNNAMVLSYSCKGERKEDD